jgi:O-antigen ligase
VLALWVVSFFVTFVALGNAALKAGAVASIIALFVTLARESQEAWANLRAARFAIATVAFLLAWLILSALWADYPLLVLSQVRWQLLCGFIFVAVIVAVRTERHLVWLAGAFVAGALLTTALALAGVNEPSGAAFDHGVTAPPMSPLRLQGGSGDPNVFAAAVVAAAAIAAGLLFVIRSARARLLIITCIALLGVGFVGSQSRGGAIAALVALLVALAVLRRQRARVFAAASAVVLIAALWMVSSPRDLQRFTMFDDQGDARTELWQIAWRMTIDHPILGVGLNNYVPHAPDYVLLPGTIQFITLIIERPVVVHNTFLQFAAESGLIGAGLFLILIGVCWHAMLRAGRLFERSGAVGHAALARCLFVASVALLVAGFFYSSGVDYKLWFCLALGPAALVIARKRSQGSHGPSAQIRPVHHGSPTLELRGRPSLERILLLIATVERDRRTGRRGDESSQMNPGTL